MTITQQMLNVDLNDQVARKEWKDNKYLLIEDVMHITMVYVHSNGRLERTKYVPTLSDLIANDWYKRSIHVH